MLKLKNKTVAEIAINDLNAVKVFKKHNIDFCCKGGITLEKACEKYDISMDYLLEELKKEATSNTLPGLNFSDWPIDFLVDYIVRIHHTYINETITPLNEFSSKIARLYGKYAPETIEIDNIVTEISNDLLLHLEREETILFPAIKARAKDKSFKYDQDVIELLEEDHDGAGIMMKRIEEITNNFTTPSWACSSTKAFYQMLEDFRNDLYQHIHLENNILFEYMKH